MTPLVHSARLGLWLTLAMMIVLGLRVLTYPVARARR
jgi:hypothetical protein